MGQCGDLPALYLLLIYLVLLHHTELITLTVLSILLFHPQVLLVLFISPFMDGFMLASWYITYLLGVTLVGRLRHLALVESAELPFNTHRLISSSCSSIRSGCCNL